MKANTTEKTTLRGELALIVAVIINSFGVVLTDIPISRSYL